MDLSLIPVNKNSNEHYKRKCSQIKKVIKRFVYENAALCDYVYHLQERVIGLKEERTYLLKKVHTYESVAKLSTTLENVTTEHKPVNTAGNQKLLAIKKRAQELSWERMRPKKTTPTHIKRKTLVPVPVDNVGVPSFPINLGSLCVYSLGEVIADRVGFHEENVLYPVGYCSTRIYGSASNPTRPVIYTCMILDGGTKPVFEIACEPPDADSPFTGDNINKVHSELLQRINMTLGGEVVNIKGRGADFFGLSHPTVMNLLQGSPAAKKCVNYIPTKFEINRAGDPSVEENDATLTFESLQRSVNFSRSHMDDLEKETNSFNAPQTLRGLLGPT